MPSKRKAKSAVGQLKTQATSSVGVIRDWWTKWPNALVGVPTGKSNGFTVLDVDKKNGVDGFETLINFGVNIESLDSPMVRTPTGGMHIYFRYSPTLKNSVSKIGPGLDVRNDGGYVIAAGEIQGLGKYEARFR